ISHSRSSGARSNALGHLAAMRRSAASKDHATVWGANRLADCNALVCDLPLRPKLSDPISVSASVVAPDALEDVPLMTVSTARPGTFLVVDDSALHHQMYRLIFSKGPLAGSTVHHAMNGREGYALLAAHPEITVVLLDLNMPEMNGLEFLAKRRAENL